MSRYFLQKIYAGLICRLYIQTSSENDDRDAVVVTIQIAIPTQVITAEKSLPCCLFKDRKRFAGNTVPDLPLLLHFRQTTADGKTDFPAAAGGTIAVDNFDRTVSKLTAAAKCMLQKGEGFLYGRHILFDVDFSQIALQGYTPLSDCFGNDGA